MITDSTFDPSSHFSEGFTFQPSLFLQKAPKRACRAASKRASNNIKHIPWHPRYAGSQVSPNNAPVQKPNFESNLFFTMPKLLMQRPDLLLHINILHHVQPAISLLHRRAIVTHSRLLPSCCFLLRDRLPGYTIKQIAALTCQTLQVVRHILGGEIGRCCSAAFFGFLFFPTRVEEFNCKRKILVGLFFLKW